MLLSARDSPVSPAEIATRFGGRFSLARTERRANSRSRAAFPQRDSDPDPSGLHSVRVGSLAKALVRRWLELATPSRADERHFGARGPDEADEQPVCCLCSAPPPLTSEPNRGLMCHLSLCSTRTRPPLSRASAPSTREVAAAIASGEPGRRGCGSASRKPPLLEPRNSRPNFLWWRAITTAHNGVKRLECRAPSADGASRSLLSGQFAARPNGSAAALHEISRAARRTTTIRHTLTHSLLACASCGQ